MSEVRDNYTFNVIGQDGAVSDLFLTYGLYETEFDIADIVVLTGGEDINPTLYGEERRKGTHINDSRDKEEVAAYKKAIDQDKMIVGICRGAQLVHVLNGGKLWQHVNGHAIGGNVHPATDLLTGDFVLVTSCHHQMMRVENVADPAFTGKIVTIANESTERYTDKSIYRPAHMHDDLKFRSDIEVIWYPKTKALCYQGHPEYRAKECTKYFTELLKRYKFI